jgi:hypothetical protein
MFIDSQEILSSSDFIERYCFMLCVRFTTPMSNCITGEKINVKVHKQPLKKTFLAMKRLQVSVNKKFIAAVTKAVMTMPDRTDSC